MNTPTLLAFAVVAVVGIATPGPTVLLALANGSRYGVRRAGFGVAGAVTSDLILIGAVALGLGALLAASEFWFTVVKWLGIAYLAHVGIALLRSTGQGVPAETAPPGQAEAGPGTPRALFLRSLLVAITNPKGYLFFTAFLPQFVAPGEPQAPQYLALALTFATLDAAIMLAYAALGSRAVRLLSRSGARWLDRLCGGALLTLAASLALVRRGTT